MYLTSPSSRLCGGKRETHSGRRGSRRRNPGRGSVLKAADRQISACAAGIGARGRGDLCANCAPGRDVSNRCRHRCKISAELDPVRKEIAAKTARNEQLRAQLAAAKTQLATPKGKETAASHLNKGDSWFREKRYEEALSQSEAAAKLDPNSAVAANNVGFAYYKVGDFNETIRWTKRATTVDPNSRCRVRKSCRPLLSAQSRRGGPRQLREIPSARAEFAVLDYCPRRPGETVGGI
jgi:tetratricopeptide (TPR) repeat protein